MKIDIDVNEEIQGFSLKFFVNEFKSDRDYKIAVEYLCCIAGDFSLDPDLSSEDLMKIADDTRASSKEEFVFEISEEGIEAEII